MIDKPTALINYASTLTNLKLEGNNYVGCCPMHDEKSGSFKIKKDGEKYMCFGGCGGGDVFDLYQAVTGASFLEAKKALGFWDDSRPTPERIKNAKVWDKELIYKEENKKEIYLYCIDAILSHVDIVVIKDEVKIASHNFVFDLMLDNENYLLFFANFYNRIPEENEIFRKLVFDNFFKRIKDRRMIKLGKGTE